MHFCVSHNNFDVIKLTFQVKIVQMFIHMFIHIPCKECIYNFYVVVTS